MLSVEWRDGIELVADSLGEEAYISEDEEEGEDEWDPSIGCSLEEKEWLKPRRKKLVGYLARIMPYHHMV